jgi:SAM-dependent methyltransferase
MTNEQTRKDQVRTTVRERYGQIAELGGSCGCTPGCCSPEGQTGTSATIGYSAEELAAVPEGADMGLGCGNPQAIAALKAGETVLDLGSGGGFDCFLAARQVGPEGRVIGVDMTPQMITKARANAERVQARNVEFRLGEIEHLPVESGTVDAIISNCVINLSPDKASVLREAFRVLSPGGRLAISDIVATAEIPAEIRADLEALTGCIAGATPVADLEKMLADAGFEAIRVEPRAGSAAMIRSWMAGAEEFVASATIEARKPNAQKACCGPSCCT